MDDERKLARDIVEELNSMHSERMGVMLSLVGWEDTLPGYSRPQSQINDDLDKCQYFIGLLWTKWGSPPDEKDGEFTSGFEEEFFRAEKNLVLGKMKDMVLFFRDVPEEQLEDPGPSLQKVIEFRSLCEERRKPFFKNYSKLNDFRKLVTKSLTNLMWNESNFGLDDDPVSPSEKAENTPVSAESVIQNSDRFFSQSEREFVIALGDRPDEWEATDAMEVARLRLIAFSRYRSGNDKVLLGNHDANLIFKNRSNLKLSKSELGHLIETGISGYTHQNVPLWYWVANSSDAHNPSFWFGYFSLFGENAETKSNAIKLLTLLKLPVPNFGGKGGRRLHLKRWLSDKDQKVSKAGVGYIKSIGDFSFIDDLNDIICDVSGVNTDIINEAIAFLLSHKSYEKALKKILDENLTQLSDDTITRIFSSPSSLSTSILNKTLQSSAVSIRKLATSILSDREALSEELATALLKDSDYSIRRISAEYLLRIGSAPNESEVKRLLTKTAKNSILSVMNNFDDTNEWKIYRTFLLSTLSLEQLEARTRGASIFDTQLLISKYANHGRRYLDEMRENIDQRFAGFLTNKIKQVEKLSGIDSKLYKDTQKLLPDIAENLVIGAVEILSKFSLEEDLSRIRDAIDEYKVSYFPSTVTYLAKNGEWEDVHRLIEFMNTYQSKGVNLLMSSNGDKTTAIAKALLSLCRNRLKDLLALTIPPSLLAKFLEEMPLVAYRELSNGIIINLMKNESAKVRKITSAKCSIAFTKKRIADLLIAYDDEDNEKYYNSVHWLDLGATMPKKIIRQIATDI